MKEGENALILFERISYLLSDLCHFVVTWKEKRLMQQGWMRYIVI